MKALKTLVLVVLAAAPFAAQAKTYDLGNISAAGYVPFAGYVSRGYFSDEINFSIDGLSDMRSFAQSLEFSLGSFLPGGAVGATFLDISDFVVSLSRVGTPGIITPSGSMSLFSSASALSFNDIVAGSYVLTLSGRGTGAFGGAYFGNLQVAAVPELETWLMLLIAIGLVAYQLRRKQGVLARPLTS